LNRQEDEYLAALPKCEPYLRDSDRHITMVDNHNAQGVTVVLEDSPNGLDPEAHAVAVESTPSIDNAEYRAEKPENQTCDSCDKRDFLHGVMRANAQVNHPPEPEAMAG
jgi:hypothetical protein